LTRARAAFQIVGVAGGVLAVVFGLERFGLGTVSESLSPSLGIALHVGVTGAVSLALVAVASWGDERPLEKLGLVRAPWLRTLGFGVGGAIATYVVTAIFTVSATLLGQLLSPAGHDEQLATKARAMTALADVPLWLILPLAIFAGIYEEIVFRGFLLARLRTLLDVRDRPLLGPALAAVVSALLFAVGHGYQGGIGVVQTFVAGLCFALLALGSRSLWPAILAHASIDAFGLFALHVVKPMLEKQLHELGK
jgi:membrane protease YdiL (CAAX protease family)